MSQDITYLQKIRIVQQELTCCENTYISDILNDEEIWEEIHNHEDWIKGLAEKNPYLQKDFMNGAEWEVKARWAYSIYTAVKEVLDKGEDLK